MGYGEDQFGFRKWDRVGKKIIRSRDVVFNEKVFSALNIEENLQVSISLSPFLIMIMLVEIKILFLQMNYLLH